jgi:hypothetical protein
MKKPILILILLAAISASGQNFPTDSAYWKVQFVNIDCNDYNLCYEYQYFLKGDTLFGDKTYDKIYLTARFFYNWTQWTFDDLGYQGAIYYDHPEEKVYWRPSGALQDTLLYDFNLSVGDTLPETFVYDRDWMIIRIDLIDTIMNNNDSIVRYHMDNAGWGGEYILHGIGSTTGFLEPIYPFFESENHLSCFQNYTDSISYPGPDYQNCEIFTTVKDNPENPGHIRVYPNPAYEVLNIDNATDSHIQLFSVTGLLISESEITFGHSELSLKGIPEGMYYLRFGKDSEILVKKIVVSN